MLGGGALMEPNQAWAPLGVSEGLLAGGAQGFVVSPGEGDAALTSSIGLFLWFRFLSDVFFFPPSV